MSLFDFFKKKLPVVPPPVEPKYRAPVKAIASSDLRLYEFQSHPDMVAGAISILGHEHFRIMFDVLKNESPENWEANKLQPHEIIERHGFIAGYHRCLNNLMAMKKVREEKEPLVADFGVE